MLSSPTGIKKLFLKDYGRFRKRKEKRVELFGFIFKGKYFIPPDK
jgi:hypothetical protein